MTTLPRLISRSVPSFNADGTVKDLADPDPAIVCFLEISGTLSRIARFNGIPGGTAYSVAQHSVMGAQAILNEGGSQREATLFLLHDAHEWALGDITRPMQDLLCGLLPSLAVKAAIERAKSAWDDAIYHAAGLPLPSAWTPRERKTVKAMDDRMCAAEAVALFGRRAASQFPPFVVPKTTGAIKPWPSVYAEEKLGRMLRDALGDDRITDQAAIAAAARALRSS
jgi:uncharacterized protein